MQLRISHALVLAGACVVLGSAATAQDINIDVHNAFGTPSSGYGAAAAQPGTWNYVNGSATGTVFPLVDISGAATSASVSYTSSSGNFSFNFFGTTGDDEALLDDLQDIGQGSSKTVWTFTGLEPGNYQVYTYCWDPGAPSGSFTNVKVVGSPDPDQIVGGDWAGSHALSVTYAKHAVGVIAGSQVVIELTVAVGFGSINGVQLVNEGGSVQPANFCTSRPSSLPNCTPGLTGATITASKSGGPGSYDITATPTPGGGNPGILIYSKIAPVSPFTTPFGSLCLSPFLRAGNLQFVTFPGGTSGVCNGSYVWDGGGIIAFYGQIAVGDLLHFQAWYRDPGNPGTANFTEGVGPITITP